VKLAAAAAAPIASMINTWIVLSTVSHVAGGRGGAPASTTGSADLSGAAIACAGAACRALTGHRRADCP
jgi:hypothetical protein